MEHILGRERKGNTRRFFSMLWKARIPYLWIAAYILTYIGIVKIGIGVTEYTAELFAGNVGLGIVIPFLTFSVINLAIALISGILNYICLARTNRNMRRMVWRKVVKLPLSYYEKNQPGELISRVTTDVTTVSTLIMHVFVALITSGYSIFALLKKIAEYDRQLMINLVLALPLEILLAYIMGKLGFGVADLINKRNAELTRTVSERVGNYILIKTAGMEKKEYQTGEARMKEHYKSSIISSWLGFSGPMFSMAGSIQIILIILIGRSFYADGTLTLSQWIAYFTFGTSLFNTLSAYCGYWTTCKGAQGATNRVTQIMAEKEEDVNKGKTVMDLGGDIILEDVSFSYGEEFDPVFENLTLRIPKNRVVAVIGPSGSGKTTLLNIIERMYPITSGTIRFGEDDISKYSLKSFREHISYMTQECTLFSGTIRSNLSYGIRREVTEREMIRACEEAGIWEFISSCPGGLDMDVGEGGDRLSGGQRQKIAFARVLMMQSNYLFMDEATSAMDVRNKAAIWDGLRAQMKNGNGTILMVAHDSQTVREADYIIVLQDGKLIAAGEAEDVAKVNPYYQQLIAAGEEVRLPESGRKGSRHEK